MRAPTVEEIIKTLSEYPPQTRVHVYLQDEDGNRQGPAGQFAYHEDANVLFITAKSERLARASAHMIALRQLLTGRVSEAVKTADEAEPKP